MSQKFAKFVENHRVFVRNTRTVFTTEYAGDEGTQKSKRNSKKPRK